MRVLHPNCLICQHFQKGQLYITFYLKTKLFSQKEIPNVVSAIKIRIDSCFYVANNVVPVQDILDIHIVDDTITEAARYNARIWCHYIAWGIKILLKHLNEVNNCFT